MIVIHHSDILQGKVALVELEGSLNSATSADFEKYVDDLLQKNFYYLLLDAKGVDHISSEGIGALLYIQQKLSMKNGYFLIFNLTDEVKSLCEILGFDKVFRIAKGRIEALEIMDRQIELREKTDGENSDAGITAIPEEPDRNIFEKSPAKEEDLSFIENEIVEDEIFEPSREESEFEPFIVECRMCKSLIRIKKSGDYLCPDCRNEFSVLQDQTVRF